MSNKVWSKTGSVYAPADTSDDYPKLPVGLYTFIMTKQGLMLQRTGEDFSFNYKIYGQETEFINRVIKTYENTTGNLGVLLNGVKGTGKTVTAKQIANRLDMPVIMMSQNLGDGYLSSVGEFVNANIRQDVCMFFDEFEKVFPSERGATPAMLTAMDGIYNNTYRKMFLMTTNEIHLNDSFMERPSRIRYIKKFGDLELNTIEEVVDDLLEHRELRGECIDFISKMNIITIDIIKELINEVNIHHEEPSKFKDIFNVKPREVTYDVMVVPDGDQKNRKAYYTLKPGNLTLCDFSELLRMSRNSQVDATNRYGEKLRTELGNLEFYVRGAYQGRLHKVISETEAIFVVSPDDSDDEEGEVYGDEVQAILKTKEKVYNTITIEKNESRHGSFYGYGAF